MNKIFSWFLQYVGVNACTRLFLDKKIFVLNYHSVSSEVNKEQFQSDLYPHLSIDVSLFEKHIQLLLKNGHTFITPKDLLVLNITKLHKPTIIYFDDGYKDNLVNALPVLKKNNIKATVFVTSGLAVRSHMLWTIKHRAFLLKQNINSQEREKVISSLKTLSKNERENFLRTTYENAQFVWQQEDQNIFLDWKDLTVLIEEGWEIGSHSVSHSNLQELTKEKLRIELVESKNKIEEKLKVSVISFSYPHGQWNLTVNKALEEAGYRIVVSIGAGLNQNNLSDSKNLLSCFKTVPVKIKDTEYEFSSKLYSRHFLRS